MLNAIACFAITGVSRAQTMLGVNLAGAGFSANVLPGVYGLNFIYPNKQEIDYFAGHGMNVFRLSVLWERLQPTLYGKLDSDELARLTAFIGAAEAVGGTVILDVHNYGAYRNMLIGPGGVDSAAFADLWTRLAERFGRDDHVIFGLMNEPKQPDPEIWRGIVQQSVIAIRKTGAENRIFISGTAWDSAQYFGVVSGPSLMRIVDPNGRLVFEVHEYFDPDSSGTSDQCVSPTAAVGRLAPFTQWLRSEHQQGFLGEFGVGRNPKCLAVLHSVLSYLKRNNDVWLGWTYWAGGPLWGDYMFTLEPQGRVDRPQMKVIEMYLHAPQGLPASRHG